MKSKEIDGLGREYDAYPTNVKRGRRRNVLTAGEKLEIAYQAIVEKRKWADVAKAYRTTIGVVSMLISKV